MKKNVIAILIIFLSINLIGQTIPPLYIFYIRQADSLSQLKDYKQAGNSYSSAFKTLGNKGSMNDRYNAARVWSLANVTDSSFDCLMRIINKGLFTDLDKLVKEKDFTNLHADLRWNLLLDTLRVKKDRKKKHNPKSATITVKNNLKETVYVYWIDFSNKEIFYFDLEPNAEKTQETFIGHAWVIRQKKDMSRVIKFTVTQAYQHFDTNGQIREDK